MAAPQQGNQSDNSAGILWGVAGAFAALGIIWFIFKNQIVSFYLSIKLYELNAASFIDPERFESLRLALQGAIANPAVLTFREIVTLGSGAGEWLRYPFVVLLVILAVVVYFGNATRVFRRTYNMHDLAKLEKDNWPQISPVINSNLLKMDIDKGPWSMAMTPLQFCKRNNLLEEIRPKRHEGMTRREWDKAEVVLKRGEANKLFALQLGQLWRGTTRLPPHIKALFAVFAARISGETKVAAALLDRLSLSAAAGKLNLTGVDELIKKHEKSKRIQMILETHAYVLTVMASMLEGAREDGVQASADFLWLKPIDRRLWYTLNTVGRQTPFAEVAGIFAHWIAEKAAGRKIIVPMTDEATKALELALTEVVYRAEEEV